MSCRPESVDNAIPPPLDRRQLLDVALDLHDCRRLTLYSKRDEGYAFSTVEELMRLVESVARPGEGLLWSHGHRIHEAMCPDGTLEDGKCLTYEDTKIQKDLTQRIDYYSEFPLDIVSYNPKITPDFVIGAADGRTGQVVVSLVADHYSSGIDKPVTPQRAIYIETGLVQALVHLLSARQAFGTFFSVLLHNHKFSRLVMLSENCIAVETTAELYSTPGLDNGPYSRVIPLEGLLCHPVFLAHLLAHEFPKSLQAAGAEVSPAEHAWFTFMLYAVRVLRGHPSPSKPLSMPLGFRALFGQRLGFTNPQASHTERLRLIKERWHHQHSESGCLCFLNEPASSVPLPDSGWTESSELSSSTASSQESAELESASSVTQVRQPTPVPPSITKPPSSTSDSAGWSSDFDAPPVGTNDDQVMHVARKEILLRKNLFVVLVTPRELDSILAASLGPAPAYRPVPHPTLFRASSA